MESKASVRVRMAGLMFAPCWRRMLLSPSYGDEPLPPALLLCDMDCRDDYGKEPAAKACASPDTA